MAQTPAPPAHRAVRAREVIDILWRVGNIIKSPEYRPLSLQYGRETVPMSDAVRDLVKFRAGKGVALLGFVPREEVPRHQYMKVLPGTV